MPYQNMFGNQYMPTFQQPQWSSQPVNGVVKVNGRDSAMQYQLPPNSTSPALFDNNGKTFYIVSTDGTGMKTVEAFDFFPHVEQPPEPDNRYVGRHEFDEVISQIKEAINGIHGSVSASDLSNTASAGIGQ